MRLFSLRRIILIIILVIAAVLRFWNLGNVPPSASLDEASIGYNSYSVLKTGGDEYGKFPIISQRGYDDWRRSTYLFLTLPFITFFGLNAVSVRLPAVILSVLTVVATYFLVRELFPNANKFSIFSPRGEVGNFQFSIGEIATLLLAISPWHIYISRLGHESNACLSFLVFGVLFFLQGNKDKSVAKIFLSMIFFTLSMISYYSGQALIPLFVVGLLFLYRKNILSIILSDKKTLIPFLIFLILLIPVVMAIFSKEALIRFGGTSTFNMAAHSEMFAQDVETRNKAVERHDVIGTFIYNRHLFPVKVFIQGYVSHFNPQWLFTNSSGEPFKAPNMGLMYEWEIPFIIIGILVILFNPLIDGKIKKLIFLWFFLGPLPGAIATQAPHAMRSYNFVLNWQIFAAFGLGYLFYGFRKFKMLFLSAFVFLVFYSLAIFYKNYFVIFPKEQSSSFQYALSRTMPFVIKHEKQYNKIVFSNQDNLYQSYMFFLFYSKYDPSLYQSLGGTKSGGFAETHQFGKYEFRPITWSNGSKTRGILYVGNASDFPQDIESLFIGYDLDKKNSVKVVKGG